jgi:hypothetical protein
MTPEQVLARADQLILWDKVKLVGISFLALIYLALFAAHWMSGWLLNRRFHAPLREANISPNDLRVAQGLRAGHSDRYSGDWAALLFVRWEGGESRITSALRELLMRNSREIQRTHQWECVWVALLLPPLLWSVHDDIADGTLASSLGVWLVASVMLCHYITRIVVRQRRLKEFYWQGAIRRH